MVTLNTIKMIIEARRAIVAKKKVKTKRLPTVLIHHIKYYQVASGIACEGTIDSHTIHRVAGNNRAALNKVQRAFNRRAAL